MDPYGALWSLMEPYGALPLALALAYTPEAAWGAPALRLPAVPAAALLALQGPMPAMKAGIQGNHDFTIFCLMNLV